MTERIKSLSIGGINFLINTDACLDCRAIDGEIRSVIKNIVNVDEFGIGVVKVCCRVSETEDCKRLDISGSANGKLFSRISVRGDHKRDIHCSRDLNIVKNQ